jgi:hypothetical protein
MSIKVYCARPITKCSFDEVVVYYMKTCRMLKSWGAYVMHPMIGKECLHAEKSFKGHGYTHDPAICDHAILQRDSWMVCHSDILFINLECGTGAEKVSIGCVGELLIGHHERKHTIVVMGESNIHQHCFIKEAADIVYPTYDDAMKYLKHLLVDYNDMYPYKGSSE